jgi:tetratricopeptide (TPR) repeat protein
MFKSDENRRFWLICLVLALGSLIVYGKLAGYDFASYDDETYVTANVHVQHGPFLNQLVWAFTTDEGGNWHPLTWLSHILDCRLYGLWAGGHHLTNLILHLANTLLFFVLLRRMTGALWRSAIVAALFAWHPSHVESVAWIAERKDVLSTFFGLLAMAAYLGYVEKNSQQKPNSKNQTPEKHQTSNLKGVLRRLELGAGSFSGAWFLVFGVYYALSLFCFLLALLSKPMLVTLPFVLLLLDYWPLRRTSNLIERRVLLEKVPFFILSGVSSAITMVVQSRGGVVTLATVSLGQRIANALVSYVRYLENMVWPVDLCVIYPYRLTWPLWLVVACGLFLALTTCVVFAHRRNRPWLAVGWLWYLGTLVPVIGIVQVGLQSMADRYSYLPLVGIFIMLVWEFTERLERLPRNVGRAISVGLGATVLVTCLTLSWFQVTTWRNAISLFTHAVSVTADNYVAHVNLGVELYHAGKPEEAVSHFNTAFGLRPDSPLPAYNLGRCYEQLGDLQRAANWFERAVETKPEFAPARYDFARLLAKQNKLEEAIAQYNACLLYTRDPASVHFSLANALAAQGKLSDAAEHYRQSLELDPNSPDAHNNLGAVLLRLGNPAAAVDHFKAALKLQPNLAEAEDQLGGALQKLGQLDEARRHFAEAVRLKPNLAHAQLKLGLLLAQQSQFEEAKGHFQKVTQLEPSNDVAWFNLAGIFAAQGRLDDAAAAFNTVVLLKPQDVEAHTQFGAVLARAGKFEAALAEYQQAATLTNQRNPVILALLDQAYAEAGRFAEAISTAQHVQELAKSLNQPALAEQAARRLELYRDGKRPSVAASANP